MLNVILHLNLLSLLSYSGRHEALRTSWCTGLVKESGKRAFVLYATKVQLSNKTGVSAFL